MELNRLFKNNLAWAADRTAGDPEYFSRLSKQQKPEYLWIGCADSRVPANEIVGLLPGELFVHRNLANVVVHTDLNCQSVLHFAVEKLKVRHIIVCGHYGCSGVASVVAHECSGISEHWLRHVDDVAKKHAGVLAEIDDVSARVDLLCVLNVVEQVKNVCRSNIVRNAWENGQPLTVHGLVYGLADGVLHDLHVSASSRAEYDRLSRKTFGGGQREWHVAAPENPYLY